MANIFLKFPHKALRFFHLTVIIISIAIIISDVGGSIFLNRYLASFQRELERTSNMRFDFRSAFFELFTGIRINGLRFSQDEKDIFSARRIRLHFDLLKFALKKRVYFKKLFVWEPYIYKTESIDKKVITTILSGIQKQKDTLRSTIIKLYDLNMMDVMVFDMKGYVAFAQTKLFLTRGKLKIKKAVFLQHDVVIAKTQLGKDLNYTFEATYLGDDFLINRLEVTGYGAAHLLLTGRISDFMDTVSLEIEGDIKSILLDEIGDLNNQYFSTKGYADVSLHTYGSVEQPTAMFKAKFRKCNLSFFDLLYIKKIQSDLTWDGKNFFLELSGFVDNSPLNFYINMEKRNVPQIHSEVSIQKLGFFHNAKVNFQGYLLNKIVGGDIEATFDYTQNKVDKRTSLMISNMYFNFDELNFRSNALDMVWIKDLSKARKQSPNAMSFKELYADIITKRNAFSLENCQATIYGGYLNGSADFMFDVNDLVYDAKLYLQHLNIEDFAKEFLSLGYQLSGVLSGTVALSSERKKAISGEVQVINGQVRDNAVLVAVSDFFNIPSLRTIDFNKLRINFLKSWDKYHTGINLFADKITIYLDNQFYNAGLMDGYLSVRLDSSLMDESSRFSYLFKKIEYEEPTVYFSFNLKGYVDNPRIEWLQNEFKEKLGRFLKDKHKKILQDQLNKLAKDFMK